MVSIAIKPEYGYVIGVGIASAFMCTWHGITVGMARKKYGVKYPTMYANKAEVKEADAFNCYQRAHGNLMENYPQFLMMLFLGGVEHPLTATACGLIWMAGRVAFALGYQTGDPSKRMNGAFQYIGLLSLLGLSVKFAYNLVSAA